VRGAVGTALLV